MKISLKTKDEKENWEKAYKQYLDAGESAKVSERLANCAVLELRRARRLKFNYRFHL